MTKRNVAILALLLGALAGLKVVLNSPSILRPTTDAELAKASVMITNLSARSGGSGVILSSDKKGSKILTNAHVCGVVKNGGRIFSQNQTASVVSYQTSSKHDLCLITTNTNLGVNTKISEDLSYSYTQAAIVGHPQLYPTLVTRGHFSGYMTIQVLTGIRPCSDEELNSDLAIVCVFLGGIPIVKSYETQVVSATIQAGSSGSPVFNQNGEIGGLVFAGSGDMSYAFIVPQEYVNDFVNNEVKNIKHIQPDTTLSIQEMSKSSNRAVRERIKHLLRVCDTTQAPELIEKLCTSLNSVIVR